MAPTDSKQKQYGGKKIRLACAKWKATAVECQKFRAAQFFTRVSNPTGVIENQIFGTAITKHLENRDKMSDDAHYFPQKRWNNHLAYFILSRMPKIKDDCKNTIVTLRHADDHVEELESLYALRAVETSQNSHESVESDGVAEVPEE